LLFCTALVSTGFGNVINDIRDVISDKISHPNRPLPRGEISLPGAWLYSVFLAIAGIVFSFSISFTHGIATLIPLIILTLYSFYLKGTPLLGNIVVASLVAYSILFGAINANGFNALIIPAILAFLLNFSREIIKDIQDEKGDQAIQVFTSAKLSSVLLKTLIYLCSLLYFCLLFLPAVRGDFGIIYILVCSILIIPIHLYRLFQIQSTTWKNRLSRISFLYKIEMICGLLSLAADRLFLLIK
jgi:geranylgeranylglycerol-phosphate geranylgeranyltransferase